MKTLKFITVLAMVLAFTAFAVNVDIFAKADADEVLEEGKTASNFYLQDANGKKVSLTDCTKAKGFILIFTTNKNAYLPAYQDKIINLNKRYKQMGYPVIVVNPNLPKKDSEDNLKYLNQQQEEQVRYLYLLDDGQKVYPNYVASKIPLVYVLQKKADGFEIKFMGSFNENKKNKEVAVVGTKQQSIAPAIEAEKIFQ